MAAVKSATLNVALIERLAHDGVGDDLAGEAGDDQPRRVHQAAAGQDRRFTPADRQALAAMPERQPQQLAQRHQQDRDAEAPRGGRGSAVEKATSRTTAPSVTMHPTAATGAPSNVQLSVMLTGGCILTSRRPLTRS